MDNRLAHPAEGRAPPSARKAIDRTLGASAAQLQQLPERRGVAQGDPAIRAAGREQHPCSGSKASARTGPAWAFSQPTQGRGPGARGVERPLGVPGRQPGAVGGDGEGVGARPGRLRGQGDLPEPAVGVDVVEDHEPSVRRHEQGRAPADQGDADDLPPDLDAADDPPGGDLDDRRRAVLQARRDPPAAPSKLIQRIGPARSGAG